MDSYNFFVSEAGIRQLKDFTRNLTPLNISAIRTEIQLELDGEVFFPYRSWPAQIRSIFNNCPLSDSQTFKLFLFLYGNGCPPITTMKYLCTSFFYSPAKIDKRIYQIKYLCSNVHIKRDTWYYFDIHKNELIYLNGSSINRNI